jgi:hypothetical protein
MTEFGQLGGFGSSIFCCPRQKGSGKSLSAYAKRTQTLAQEAPEKNSRCANTELLQQDLWRGAKL